MPPAQTGTPVVNPAARGAAAGLYPEVHPLAVTAGPREMSLRFSSSPRAPGFPPPAHGRIALPWNSDWAEPRDFPAKAFNCRCRSPLPSDSVTLLDVVTALSRSLSDCPEQSPLLAHRGHVALVINNHCFKPLRFAT